MIRPAEQDDLPILKELVWDYCLHEGGGRLSPDRKAISDYIDANWLNPHAVILVLDLDGQVRGCIGIALTLHHFTGVLQAVKTGWLVSPKYSGHGLRLLAEAEKWALAQGAKQMQVSAPTERTTRLLRSKGYTLQEMIYTKTI